MGSRFFSITGILLTLILLSCSTAEKKEAAGEIQTRDRGKALELQRCLIDINKNSPETVSSSFTLSGDNKGKKYKFGGSFLYDKKGLARIKLSDYIFKSPVLSAYRNMDKLFFYYPAEKKLYVDDYNKIEFSRYAGYPADFKFIYHLFSGRIPELKDGKVVKCLEQSGGKSHYLILENDKFYESIYFRGNVPEKILIIHKVTKKKAEIYIKSVVKKGSTVFFKKVKIITPVNGFTMEVNFYGTKINKPLKITPFKPSMLKRGVEIIKVN